MSKYHYEYFFDDELAITHIEKHDVSAFEIEEFFEETRPITRKRKDDSYTAIGKLKSGRYLEVIYRLKSKSHVYIITAYDLENREYIALLDEQE